MQQTVTWKKWGVLAAALAVFSLAFALFAGTAPAQADEGDLGAGALTTQDDSTAYFAVYTKLEGKDEVLAKAYTEEEFAKLASSTSPASIVYSGKGALNVVTAKSYVTLDALFEDAGVSDYWVDSSSVSVFSSDGSAPSASDNLFTKAALNEGKFYPNKTTVDWDDTGAVAVSPMFGVTYSLTKVGDGETAADVAKANESAEAETKNAPYFLSGYSTGDYASQNLAGNKQWKNVAKVTITYTQATQDQIDADAVWPFTVYVQYGAADPVKVKEYTKDEFTALKSSETDPVSGQYFKGGSWNVATAVTYVTLEDLLADAGVAWGKGATIGYGGDPAQGKTSNSFTYEDLQDMYFYPKTTAGAASTEDAVETPFVFGLTSSNGGVAISDDQTAADVQKAAATDNVAATAPYAVFGSLEKDYTAGEGTSVAGKRLWRNVDSITITFSEDTQKMHRLYNQWSGEHFYTADDEEYNGLVALGWTDEGTGWTAPVISNVPVYRVYNPYAGDHHYTMKQSERDELVKAGWTDEGVGWYSDANEGEVLYREYNPNEQSHNHNYTTNKEEHDGLVALGWTDEGKAWYGVKAAG